MDEVERIAEEIRQLREQYVAEVGEGRRAWPRSIKERVYELGSLGLKPKAITKVTGIPYETVCQWKYQKALSAPKSFHHLTVTVPAKVEKSKNLAVTVKSPKNPKNLESSRNATVTVTTPGGYLIERLPADLVIEVLRTGVG